MAALANYIVSHVCCIEVEWQLGRLTSSCALHTRSSAHSLENYHHPVKHPLGHWLKWFRWCNDSFVLKENPFINKHGNDHRVKKSSNGDRKYIKNTQYGQNFEAKHDNFEVWNWNFSLINSSPCEKAEPRMGELTNPWELVQILIANSIFLGQAEVEPEMQSSFPLPIDSSSSPASLSYSLCILSGIPEAGRERGMPPSFLATWTCKRNQSFQIPTSERKYPGTRSILLTGPHNARKTLTCRCRLQNCLKEVLLFFFNLNKYYKCS